jgi:hypothetical protein
VKKTHGKNGKNGKSFATYATFATEKNQYTSVIFIAHLRYFNGTVEGSHIVFVKRSFTIIDGKAPFLLSIRDAIYLD